MYEKPSGVILFLLLCEMFLTHAKIWLAEVVHPNAQLLHG